VRGTGVYKASEALAEFEPLWNELFPAKQARTVWLVERVDVGPRGADMTLEEKSAKGWAQIVNEEC
jgi:hypothetical protein